MARGTARAAATAVLGLIAFQALSSRGGSGRVAELLGDANTLLERVLDPAVPAIPDLRNGDTWGGTSPRRTPVTSGSAAPAARWNPPTPGRPYDRRLFA